MKQPKRQRPKVFLDSIREFSLFNEDLPILDDLARRVISGFGLEPRMNPSAAQTIGSAFDKLRLQSMSEGELFIPVALKRIILGYAFTRSWTINGRLGVGTPVRMFLRGILESTSFKIRPDFESARYGALEFRISSVNRMDILKRGGQIGIDGPPMFERALMKDVQLQSVLPGQAGRTQALHDMLRRGDVSTTWSFIPLEEQRLFNSRRSSEATSNLPMIEMKADGSAKEIAKRGPKERRDDVIKVFLKVVAENVPDEIPGIDKIVAEIIEESRNFKKYGFDRPLTRNTIKKHLDKEGCYNKHTRKWNPERWQDYP